MASTLGLVFRIETEVDQRVMALARLHDHVAAFPAVPGFHVNFGLVDEHENLRAPLCPWWLPRFRGITTKGTNLHEGKDAGAENKSPGPEERLKSFSRWLRTSMFPGWRIYFTSTGSTMTNLPICPLFRNLMRPVILAKRVSSLPRPTFSHGFTRVPRCRTMMVPPGTA